MTQPSLPDPPSTRSDVASADPATPLPSRGPTDFAQLARRISSRTTDLFAVALVAVVLLYLGVQMTRWWRAEPPQISDSPASAASPLAIWDDPSGLSLEFTAGEWLLHRETVTGNEDEVSAIAFEQMQRAIATLSTVDLPPADQAEQQWLDQLRGWAPQEHSDRGDIFVLGGPWPWVVAASPANTHVDDAVSDDRRIVGWSFALPQSGDRWTLYVAGRTSSAHGAPPSIDDVPLPPGASRLLAVRSTAGGFVTFRSTVSTRRCREDWDRQLVAAGWIRIGDWLRENGQARATYRREHAARSERLDALLVEAADGATAGVCDWRVQPEDSGSP